MAFSSFRNLEEVVLLHQIAVTIEDFVEPLSFPPDERLHDSLQLPELLAALNHILERAKLQVLSSAA